MMLQRTIQMAAPKDQKANTQSDRKHCIDCRGNCLCAELQRRRAYDAVRPRKGLAALYRPPSLR
jgi:hypothetical protein